MSRSLEGRHDDVEARLLQSMDELKQGTNVMRSLEVSVEQRLEARMKAAREEALEWTKAGPSGAEGWPCARRPGLGSMEGSVQLPQAEVRDSLRTLEDRVSKAEEALASLEAESRRQVVEAAARDEKQAAALEDLKGLLGAARGATAGLEEWRGSIDQVRQSTDAVAGRPQSPLPAAEL